MDPFIEDILITAVHVTLYDFNIARILKDHKEEEREFEVVFTGLPCTCKNCGITFGSYHDYYCHLVYSPLHAPLPPAKPMLDLELKLASSGQPDVDI